MTARAKVAVAFAAVWVIVASVSLAACGSEQPTEDSTRLDAIESRLDGQQQRLTAAEAAAAGAVAVQQESAVEIHRQHGSQRERLGWLEDRAMKLENRMAELERTVEYTGGQRRRSRTEPGSSAPTSSRAPTVPRPGRKGTAT